MRMKKLITTTLVLLFLNVFAQENQFTSIVPQRDKKLEKYVVLDKDNNPIMSFDKSGGINVIDVNGNAFYLKRKKELFDSNDQLVATYKKGEINIVSNNSVVIEKKKGKKWEYFVNDKKILEVAYKYNSKDKNYHFTVLCDRLDDTSLKTMQMALGRFDKQRFFTKGTVAGFVAAGTIYTGLTLLLK